MRRAWCAECHAEVAIDDAGRCPRGHLATAGQEGGGSVKEPPPWSRPVAPGAEALETGDVAELDLSSLEAAVAELSLGAEEGEAEDAFAAFDQPGTAPTPGEATRQPPPTGPAVEPPPRPRPPVPAVEPSPPPRPPVPVEPSPPPRPPVPEPPREGPGTGDLLPSESHLAELEAAAEQSIAGLRAVKPVPEPASEPRDRLADDAAGEADLVARPEAPDEANHESDDEADLVAGPARNVAPAPGETLLSLEPAAQPKQDRGDAAVDQEPTGVDLTHFTARPPSGRGRRRRG